MLAFRSGRAVAVAVVVFTLAACRGEVDRSPVTIRIHGDSIIQMVERNNGGMVECALPFEAEVEGPQRAHAVVKGGRVDYWWWSTGAAAGSYEWNQPDAARLWVDSIFPVGTPRLSHPHGFGQGTPPQPVRGEVVFQYGASNTDEIRETEPFRFYCY
jgi:hypothetical protein